MDSIYREIIVDHSQNPRFFGRFSQPDFAWEEANVSCGDKIAFQVKGGKVKFTGEGCAISIAAASLLAENINSGRFPDLKTISKDDIVRMLKVDLSPSRLRCALIGLEALHKALNQKHG